LIERQDIYRYWPKGLDKPKFGGWLSSLFTSRKFKVGHRKGELYSYDEAFPPRRRKKKK